MDIEQLQKVGDIIGGLGEQASDGFMMYMGFLAFDTVVSYGVGVAFIIALYKLGGTALCVSRSYTIMRGLRDLLGIGCSGYLTVSEMEEVRERVEQLSNKK